MLFLVFFAFEIFYDRKLLLKTKIEIFFRRKNLYLFICFYSDNNLQTQLRG